MRREVLIVPGRAGTAYTVTAVEHASPVLDAMAKELDAIFETIVRNATSG